MWQYLMHAPLILIACIFAGYFYGWHANAVYVAHYDLAAYEDMSKYLISQILILHGSNSLFNTTIPGMQNKQMK